MTSSHVELVLGTVQFGMKYGIVGRGEPVPTKEIRAIFEMAWDYGIRIIDTAPAYGNIEEQLYSITENFPFRIVSKIPAIPPDLKMQDVRAFVSKSIQRTKKRLGESLSTLLFHSSADLLEQHGNIAWQAALDESLNSEIKFGVSCYSPAELSELQNKYPITAAQIPGNAFDQRLKVTPISNIELYLRSVFLQGILLMSPEIASQKLPQVTSKINSWKIWCEENQLSPLQAALSSAKSLPGIKYCVIGVDKLSHLEEIITAWSSSVPLNIPEMATNNIDIIDPRRWFTS